MMRGSQPLLGVTKRLASVDVPGRHGTLQGIPAFKGAPTETLVIRTTDLGLEALYALFDKNEGTGLFTLTDDSSRAAVFELASISPQGINAEDQLIDVTVTLRFPTADWRATALTTIAPASIGSGVTTHEILDGISADITDAGIFIGGDFGNMELEDLGSGSWVRTRIAWPHVASTGLLIVGATGQAYRATTAAPWTPLADMSQYIEQSGGGGFRITPTWDTDPSDRIASLQLTATNTSGVTFGVRALNAFALRLRED